jgi:hypothetical protein
MRSRNQGAPTGLGPVAEIDAAAVSRLKMRGGAGEPPLLFDELLQTVRTAPTHAATLVQLDLKTTADEIDAAAGAAFARALDGLASRFILSGYDWEAVTRLGGGVAGLAFGYDPSRRGPGSLCRRRPSPGPGEGAPGRHDLSTPKSRERVRGSGRRAGRRASRAWPPGRLLDHRPRRPRRGHRSGCRHHRRL